MNCSTFASGGGGTAFTSSTSSLNNYPQPLMLPQSMFPAYYPQLGHIYPPCHENLSPQSMYIAKGRSNSPRPVSSPLGYSSRSSSPTYHVKPPNSPSQTWFGEGLAPIANFMHSPKPPHYNPFSPRHPADRNFTGPFPFPPPPPVVRTIGNTPPPNLYPPRTQANTPPPLLQQLPNRIKSGDVTFVNGITSINNNVNKKPLCSCVSVSDLENQDFLPVPKICKDNKCEEDRLRSVSNSSDTVPPKMLYRARITHQDAPPPSHFGVPPPNAINHPGAEPQKQEEESGNQVSLPTPTWCSDSSEAQEPPHLTFSSLSAKEKLNKTRPKRSPRLSVSEVSDVYSPGPVKYKTRIPIDIKVNLGNGSCDDVFHK